MQIMQISQSLLSFPFNIYISISIMRQTGLIHNVIVTKDTGTILVSQYFFTLILNTKDIGMDR